MPKNEARLNRVNEELKKEISRVLTFELKNSKVTGLVSVTKAKITPDFKYAKVYVSILNSKSIGKTMEGLKESSGFIRSQVAKKHKLKNHTRAYIRTRRFFLNMELKLIAY